MKIIVATIVTLIYSQICYGIDEYQKGDTLFVLAKSGLDLRTTPNSKGDVISTLPYGSKITVLEDTSYRQDVVTEFKSSEGKLTFKGNWIKVSHAQQSGYIFDGYLSRLPPRIDNESFRKYAQRVFGISKVLRDESTDDGHYQLYIVAYMNGALIEEQHNSTAGDNSYYVLPNTSLQEAYLICIDRIYIVGVDRPDLDTIKLGFELGGASIEKRGHFTVVAVEFGN